MFPNKQFQNTENIFNYYLDNSLLIRKLSSGLYGLTLLLILKEDLDYSNENNFYKKLVPNDEFGKPVKELVIKISFVADADINDNERYENYFDNNSLTSNLRVTNKDDFQYEINIQTDITLKTIQYLEPLCPSIVYADVLYNDGNKSEEFLEKLIRSKMPDDDSITNLRDQYNNLFMRRHSFGFTCGIGVIAMELADKSKTLFEYVNTTTTIPKEVSLNMGRYILLQLALQTGYNHGDFHQGNILISDSNDYFGKDCGFNVKPIIIDFGRTNKINQDVMGLIRKNVNEKQYTKALAYLCSPKSSNNFVSDVEYSSYYGWVCGNYNLFTRKDIDQYKIDLDYRNISSTNSFFIKEKLNDSVNVELDKLFTAREKGIDKNVKDMDKLHNVNPMYPLLPISNEIKNKLYNGMLGGGIYTSKKYTKKYKKSKYNKSKKSKYNKKKYNKSKYNKSK